MNTSRLVQRAVQGLLAGAVGCGISGGAPSPPVVSVPPVAPRTEPSDPEREPPRARVVAKKDESAANCCKGKNECKGKGNCKVDGAQDCKGKNECKGKGGCRDVDCVDEASAEP